MTPFQNVAAKDTACLDILTKVMATREGCTATPENIREVLLEIIALTNSRVEEIAKLDRFIAQRKLDFTTEFQDQYPSTGLVFVLFCWEHSFKIPFVWNYSGRMNSAMTNPEFQMTIWEVNNLFSGFFFHYIWELLPDIIP